MVLVLFEKASTRYGPKRAIPKNEFQLMIDVEEIWQSVMAELKMAESELECGETLLVEAYIADKPITVREIGYREPCLMRIAGKDADGKPIGVLLSVEQFLKEVKLWISFPKPDEAKKEMGFHTQLSETTHQRRNAIQALK